MNKIIITGGSGFIGTNLLQFFYIKNYSILNLDIKEPKNRDHFQFWKNVDINEFDNLKNIIFDFQPNYIIHLAARTDLEGLTLDDYKTNILGVQNLMNIVKELKSLKKIIITSSMLVNKAGYYPKTQFDYNPSTIYGKSKVETEKIIWTNKPSCDWAIIRPTSIWGPWFGVPYKSFFDMILAKKYFHIGDKGCIKTYGYVGNSVYQIDKILFSNTLDESKKVFFIGDSPATDIEEWGNEIASELGFKIVKLPFLIIKLAALLGDTMKLIDVNFPMNSFRLRNMTTNNIVDLKNTFDIADNLPYTRKEGIRATLRWIKEHNK